VRPATLLPAVTIAGCVILTACSGGSGSTKAFCDTLRSGDNPLDVFDRYDPTNVTTARDQLERGVARMRQLQDAAPSEIRDDMGVLVDVGSKLVDALDPAAQSGTPPDFAPDFQKVTEASAAVTKFAADNCGVDLNSAGSEVPGGE
jgi:hypothetical protein